MLRMLSTSDAAAAAKVFLEAGSGSVLARN